MNISVPMSVLPPGVAASTPAHSGISSGGAPGAGNGNGTHHHNQQFQTSFPGSPPAGNAPLPPVLSRSYPRAPLPPVDPHSIVQEQYILPWRMSSYLGTGNQSYLGQPAYEASRDDADAQPWKYRGYPSLSKWMASDDDFFVLRRFGTLSARVALMLQDQHVYLEEELKMEDEASKRMPKGDCGTFRYDTQTRRQKILGLALQTLEKYNKFILDHSQLKARPDASAHHIKNVKTWLENTNGPINEQEAAFVEQEGDLIAVVTKEKTPLRRFMEKIGFLKVFCCFRVKKLNPTQSKTSTTIYNREALVDKCVTCITIALGLGMLIGPLWWLQQITADQSNLQTRLGIITGFIIAFCVGMVIVTVAKPFESLAATAAYAAVLMVFMQIGYNGGNAGCAGS